MWGPREHGEWVGLTDPREQEMACLSGGCKGPPTLWGLDKATLFWPGSQQVTHPGKISVADRDSGHGKEKIYQHVPKGYFGGGRVGLGIFRSFSIFISMFTFYIENILLW